MLTCPEFENFGRDLGSPSLDKRTFLYEEINLDFQFLPRIVSYISTDALHGTTGIPEHLLVNLIKIKRNRKQK